MVSVPHSPAFRATGATIQILLFAVLAIEVKRKAPTAHTVLEIVLIRWGRTAHTIFLVFCLLTNCIVTAMLILGGAAVVAALTGAPSPDSPLDMLAASMTPPNPHTPCPTSVSGMGSAVASGNACRQEGRPVCDIDASRAYACRAAAQGHR
jgi:hypothetical protein